MASISTTTMVTIALVATAMSAAGGAYSAVKQGEAADYNAKVAEQAAQAAQDKAKYDENIHRERVRNLLSQQRALFGKSGLDMTGTPLLALEDTAGQGELDALAIRYGGDVESARLKSEGRIAKMQGRASSTAGFISAGSSLLSGGYSAYQGYQASLKK